MSVMLERTAATRIDEHASGRPWLVGQWADDEVVVATVGDARVAAVGPTPPTEARLAAFVREGDALGSLGRIGANLTGGCHLPASEECRLRSQGTASGPRRLFSARVAGVVAACDRSDVPASAIDAGIDEHLVARRLMDPLIPRPLGERPAPEAELPLDEGAERLAGALADADALRHAWLRAHAGPTTNTTTLGNEAAA
ncbi:hypothetical protein Sipo8835_16750 [Streptomyces ipomoeae]|uniref:Uncharacterized protein n=1 Tax=Streptomyces ipomoeae TaxID=103232 RepID=A0AAE8W3W9_9ACTN|nr:hypothetical protein [Streptomyces ipomoeae]TQE33784.1 hypothetical protein Sipo8835_16750 [Streptomyces ipomoeae]